MFKRAVCINLGPFILITLFTGHMLAEQFWTIPVSEREREMEGIKEWRHWSYLSLHSIPNNTSESLFFFCSEDDVCQVFSTSQHSQLTTPTPPFFFLKFVEGSSR